MIRLKHILIEQWGEKSSGAEDTGIRKSPEPLPAETDTDLDVDKQEKNKYSVKNIQPQQIDYIEQKCEPAFFEITIPPLYTDTYLKYGYVVKITGGGGILKNYNNKYFKIREIKITGKTKQDKKVVGVYIDLSGFCLDPDVKIPESDYANLMIQTFDSDGQQSVLSKIETGDIDKLITQERTYAIQIAQSIQEWITDNPQKYFAKFSNWSGDNELGAANKFKDAIWKTYQKEFLQLENSPLKFSRDNYKILWKVYGTAVNNIKNDVFQLDKSRIYRFQIYTSPGLKSNKYYYYNWNYLKG